MIIENQSGLQRHTSNLELKEHSRLPKFLISMPLAAYNFKSEVFSGADGTNLHGMRLRSFPMFTSALHLLPFTEISMYVSDDCAVECT